jgi:glycosyltransferase involved in cell wall biosynthesis
MKESENPLVSIIMPVYNRAGLVVETLQSIRTQTYQNWECIVVDDGSTDNSFEVIQNYRERDKRIQVFKRIREPKGAPTCRNIGMEQSKGEFIIFLDSDDVMADFCIERRMSFFKEHPTKDFLVFQSLIFEKEMHDKNLLWNIDTEENDLNRFLRTDALWPICGPIYKREIFKKTGLFREGLSFYQDFDLHLRMLLLDCKYLKFLDLEPDCFIRYHFNNSVSNSIDFTSDKKVLQQRIDFFIYQLEFIRRNHIQLDVSQRDTLWNVLFYFSSRWLMEHGDRHKFYGNWMRAQKLSLVNPIKYYIAFLPAVLSSWQKRSKYFIKLKTLYCKMFKKYLADDKVIFNSTLHKIELAK